MSDWETATLSQFDSSTLCPVADLTVGSPSSSVIDMVADDDHVWVADFSSGSVLEIDVGGNLTRTIPDVRAGAGMEVFENLLFVACCGIGEGVGGDPITKIDTDTGDSIVIAHVDWPSAIAYGHDSIWVGSYITNTVVRLDPITGEEIATIDLQEGIINDVAVTADAIWVTSTSSLIRIDPNSNYGH